MLKNISSLPFPHVRALSQPPEDQKLKWEELQRVQVEHNINIVIEYYYYLLLLLASSLLLLLSLFYTVTIIFLSPVFF